VTDATATWTRLANTTGIPVVPTTTACAKMNNFAGNIDITGQKDALRTPALNLSGSNSSLRVVFDRSHRMYSATDIDSLNIYISTDCGGTWTRLYTKGGLQLSTVTGTLTTAYTPTANTQWVRDSVSLSSYVGQASVYLKFESRSGWGNNLYLDNINVKYTAASAPPVANFTTAATRCVGSAIAFSDASTNSPTSWTWTFPGSTTPTSTIQNPSVTYTAAGTYTITHTASNASGTSTPVTSTIVVSANPTVAVSSATVCRGTAASLVATGATTYSWNTGASTASISVTPTITTNYTVAGTNAAGCVNTKTLSVTVNATPTVVANSTTVCSGSAANITATGATTASISVTPTTNTNYSVTGTTNGCTNTKTVSVTVNAVPNVAVSNITICSGATATITASGATTYIWNTGATTANILVSPTTTTTYTVTGTSAGCSNVKTVTLTVNQLPNVTLGAISGPICVTNAPVVLTGSPVGGTFSGVGVNGSTFDPAVSGAGTFVISYDYIDANLCSATATQTVSVSLCTGIKDLTSSNISVYPNPAKDAISVSMDASLVNHTTIELYDAIGKLVIVEKVVNPQTTIIINSFAKGIYTVRIVSEGKQTAKRFIKE
jgi:PKD repeat protein